MNTLLHGEKVSSAEQMQQPKQHSAFSIFIQIARYTQLGQCIYIRRHACIGYPTCFIYIYWTCCSFQIILILNYVVILVLISSQSHCDFIILITIHGDSCQYSHNCHHKCNHHLIFILTTRIKAQRPPMHQKGQNSAVFVALLFCKQIDWARQ